MSHALVNSLYIRFHRAEDEAGSQRAVESMETRSIIVSRGCHEIPRKCPRKVYTSNETSRAHGDLHTRRGIVHTNCTHANNPRDRCTCELRDTECSSVPRSQPHLQPMMRYYAREYTCVCIIPEHVSRVHERTCTQAARNSRAKLLPSRTVST